MIHRVALKPTDLDRLIVAAEDAGSLAQLFDGTHTGAGRRHQVGLQDGHGRPGYVIGRDLADECRHVDVCRTSLNAGRVKTVQAAVRLEPRLAHAQRGFELAETLL